jgi:hypothetical protein
MPEPATDVLYRLPSLDASRRVSDYAVTDAPGWCAGGKGGTGSCAGGTGQAAVGFDGRGTAFGAAGPIALNPVDDIDYGGEGGDAYNAPTPATNGYAFIKW